MAGGYFKTHYADLISISGFDTTFRRVWLILGIILLIALPLVVTSSYYLHLLNSILIACIISLALNLVTGYAGLISLGHAGFLCVGGFVSAIAGVNFGLPFAVVMLLSIVIGAFWGLLGGLPALRLRALYFVLGTIAVHFIITFLATEYQYKSGYVSGGIPIPVASLGTLVLNSSLKWYYFLVIILGIITIFCINITRGKMGRALVATRDRDVAAQILGVNTGYYKVVSFVISGAITSLAGCLQAYYDKFVSVEMYDLWLSVIYLCMVVIGGMGSILGSFFGAGIIVTLPYGLREFFNILALPSFYQRYAVSLQIVLFGIAMAVFLIFEPKGIVAIWVRLRNFFETWPFKRVVTGL